MSNRFSLDENPVIHDSTMLKAYKTTKGVPMSCGRAIMWTLMPVMCEDASVVSNICYEMCNPYDFVAQLNFEL